MSAPTQSEEEVHGLHGRPKFKKQTEGQKDGNWMELERKKLQAYDYLCHIGEAKEWIEACIGGQVSPIEQLEEDLRNGIILARLAKSFEPDVVKRIFEDTSKLQFRHSDNINYLFAAMRKVGLPEVFLFELTDLYDKKNIPKVIYCIHALSHLLAKKGIKPQIKNLLGKLEFTDEMLDATAMGLEAAAVPMPAFGNIQSALAAELSESVEKTAEEKRKEYYESHKKQVIIVQAVVRGHLARKHHRERLAHFKANEKKIVLIQAAYRGHAARNQYKSTLSRFKSNEVLFVKVQALYKAKKQREEYLKRINFLRSNESAAVKLQAWWKGNQAMRKYRALLNNKGTADIKTVQSYLHLLDDGVNDFEEELELQRLRKMVIKGIRENLTAETEVTELDSKIALLVKNRISIEEVVHYTTKKMRAALAGSSAAALSDKSAVWTIKGNDKETRGRRRRYEELFYLLQTQPSYLARLMFTMNKKSGANVTRFLEQVVLTLYGYAQNMREEYLFLTLIDSSIHIELNDINKIEEFWRDNPFFIKLVLQYTRGAKERQFLRDLLQPLVKSVLTDSSLELESDPVALYRALIREEESRTGEKSARPYDLTPQQAAQEPDVREMQSKTFSRLKSITDKFLGAIFSSLKKMPYGIRYIAMKMKEHMKRKFPSPESEDEINKIVGNLIYYRYMNPAIVAPEAFDVIETAISPMQRKNLAEVAKMLHQISMAREIGSSAPSGGVLSPLSGTMPNIVDSNPGLTDQLNEYIRSAGKRFANFLRDAATVVSAQEQFGMDEYVDFARQEKPIIYITPEEVLQVHHNLVENLESIASNKEDPLRVILTDLGRCPAVEVAAKGPGTEVALALTNRFAKDEDEGAAKLRLLINETKRLILTVIRIDVGKSLLDILEAPAMEQQERQFADYLKQEEEGGKKQTRATHASVDAKSIAADSTSNLHSGAAGMASTHEINNAATIASANGGTGVPPAAAATTTPGSNTTALTPVSVATPASAASGTSATGNVLDLLRGPDGAFLTFAQLKVRALENMAQIEAAGQASKADSYQSMLTSIVDDMLTKQRRRAQRRREYESLRNTLTNLEDKAKYLTEQKKSYHDYIDACMAQLQNSNNKSKHRRPPMLFSKQYYHMRDLQKSGKVPQFGSFKYTAAELHKKGVLISIDDYSPKQYGQINLILSSDEVGVFHVEAAFLGVKLTEKMELRLEDLLQSQYNKVDVVTLFDMAKVNLNLLIFLINKKFYV